MVMAFFFNAPLRKKLWPILHIPGPRIYSNYRQFSNVYYVQLPGVVGENGVFVVIHVTWESKFEIGTVKMVLLEI